VELLPDAMAIVDVGGVRKDVSLALVADTAPGDYVILHVGYALTKLDREEAEKTPDARAITREAHPARRTVAARG
jgi:hydrogenase expression/formation protein HypC